MYALSFAQVELTIRELFVQCNKIPQETKLPLIMNTSDHMELTNAFALVAKDLQHNY